MPRRRSPYFFSYKKRKNGSKISSWNVVLELGRLPDGQRYRESLGGFPTKKQADIFIESVKGSIKSNNYANLYRSDLQSNRDQVIDLLNSEVQSLLDSDSNSNFEIDLINEQVSLLVRHHNVPENYTLSQCMMDWYGFIESQNRVEPSTLKGYLRAINHNLKPDLGDIKLTDFTNQDWERYLFFKKDPLAFKFGRQQSKRPKRLISHAEKTLVDSKKLKHRISWIHRASNCMTLEKEAQQFFKRFNIPEQEKVNFMILKSYYLFADNSIYEKQEERYNQVVESYLDFIKAYPESKYLREAESFYNESSAAIEKIKIEPKKKQKFIGLPIIKQEDDVN